MNRQVVYPNHQDRHIDGQNPKHKDQHGVRVVVEVVARRRLRFLSASQGTDTSEDLSRTKHQIGKLVWNHSHHQKKEHSGGKEPLIDGPAKGLSSSERSVKTMYHKNDQQTYLESSASLWVQGRRYAVHSANT